MLHFLGDIFSLLILLSIIGGIVFGGEIYLVIKKRKTLELIRNTAKSCTQVHLNTLVRKRQNLVFRNEYGTENATGWDKELDYFWRSTLGSQIANALEEMDLTTFAKKNFKDKGIKLAAIEEVNRFVTAEALQTNNQSSNNVPTNPYEYEGYCRRLLEQAGWKARQTPGSGDQGGDVIAEKEKMVVVLQCKLWNYPVGNKAVQEVVAAKALYSALVAVVVSNQPYTDSAQKLAAVNHVLLLHHNDLTSLDSRI